MNRVRVSRSFLLALFALLVAASSLRAYVLLSPRRTGDAAPTYRVDNRGQASIADGDFGRTRTGHAIVSTAAWNGAPTERKPVVNATVAAVSGWRLGDGIPMLNFLGPCGRAGSCSLDPNAPDGTPCGDDGLYCNGAETCNDGLCAGTPPTCNDSNLCTTDSCDENADACLFTAVVCEPSEDCSDPGICNPSNGECEPSSCNLDTIQKESQGYAQWGGILALTTGTGIVTSNGSSITCDLFSNGTTSLSDTEIDGNITSKGSIILSRASAVDGAATTQGTISTSGGSSVTSQVPHRSIAAVVADSMDVELRKRMMRQVSAVDLDTSFSELPDLGGAYVYTSGSLSGDTTQETATDLHVSGNLSLASDTHITLGLDANLRIVVHGNLTIGSNVTLDRDRGATGSFVILVVGSVTIGSGFSADPLLLVAPSGYLSLTSSNIVGRLVGSTIRLNGTAVDCSDALPDVPLAQVVSKRTYEQRRDAKFAKSSADLEELIGALPTFSLDAADFRLWHADNRRLTYDAAGAATEAVHLANLHSTSGLVGPDNQLMARTAYAFAAQMEALSADYTAAVFFFNQALSYAPGGDGGDAKLILSKALAQEWNGDLTGAATSYESIIGETLEDEQGAAHDRAGIVAEARLCRLKSEREWMRTEFETLASEIEDAFSADPIDGEALLALMDQCSFRSGVGETIPFPIASIADAFDNDEIIGGDVTVTVAQPESLPGFGKGTGLLMISGLRGTYLPPVIIVRLTKNPHGWAWTSITLGQSTSTTPTTIGDLPDHFGEVVTLASSAGPLLVPTISSGLFHFPPGREPAVPTGTSCPKSRDIENPPAHRLAFGTPWLKGEAGQAGVKGTECGWNTVGACDIPLPWCQIDGFYGASLHTEENHFAVDYYHWEDAIWWLPGCCAVWGTGTPIVAATPGRVVQYDCSNYWGSEDGMNLADVKSAVGSYNTIYWHLGETCYVTNHMFVDNGQEIGVMDTTGADAGHSHLHFEIRDHLCFAGSSVPQELFDGLEVGSATCWTSRNGPSYDTDQDGVLDDVDNCPRIDNGGFPTDVAYQRDSDSNGVGDVCDCGTATCAHLPYVPGHCLDEANAMTLGAGFTNVSLIALESEIYCPFLMDSLSACAFPIVVVFQNLPVGDYPTGTPIRLQTLECE